MDEKQFQTWLDVYGRAWEQGDAAAVTSLFARDAAYHETPFDPPMIGREAIRAYWQAGAGDAQRDVVFDYTILSAGDPAVAHWTASFTRAPSGAAVRLDGVLTVRFDGDGRCVEFREWWHREEEPAG
jgi:uncharacterized protein (TIGR02246 family)